MRSLFLILFYYKSRGITANGCALLYFKAIKNPRAFLGSLLLRVGINACFFLVFAHSFIPNDAIYESEQGVVFADTYVRAGMNFRTSLTNENVASENCLTVATLHAKSFRFAISTVVRGTGTFFMSE